MTKNLARWSGEIVGLHKTPRSFLPMKNFRCLSLIAGVGIDGDRHATGEAFHSDRPEEGRQITLFEEATTKKEKIQATIELRKAKARFQAVT